MAELLRPRLRNASCLMKSAKHRNLAERGPVAQALPDNTRDSAEERFRYPRADERWEVSCEEGGEGWQAEDQPVTNGAGPVATAS